MTKVLTHSIAWIVLTSLLLAAAIWQISLPAIQVLKGDSPAPPQRTRHAIRAMPPPCLSNPHTEYLGLCRKGLTEREIHWIIQDFQNAGLDLGLREVSREGCLALRKAQQRWYRGALVEGLRLSPEQSSQVAKNLAINLNLAETDLPQNPTTESMANFVSSNDWLGDDAPALKPWNLCSLTAEQQNIIEPPTRADTSGYHISAVRTPFLESQSFHFQQSAPPSQLFPASRIFPFTRQQAFTRQPNPLDTRTDRSAETLVAQVRSLHPAQLKILLLLQPAMTEQIQQALKISAPPCLR